MLAENRIDCRPRCFRFQVVTPTDIPIDRVVADGAYYDIERNEALFREGITPVISPPSHAVIHGNDNTPWHDKIVQYIHDKGTVYAFHKKYGYGLRLISRSANRSHQAMPWRNTVDAENRIAAIRRRHHRQSH